MKILSSWINKVFTALFKFRVYDSKIDAFNKDEMFVICGPCLDCGSFVTFDKKRRNGVLFLICPKCSNEFEVDD